MIESFKQNFQTKFLTKHKMDKNVEALSDSISNIEINNQPDQVKSTVQISNNLTTMYNKVKISSIDKVKNGKLNSYKSSSLEDLSSNEERSKISLL